MKQAIRTTRAKKFYTALLTVVTSISFASYAYASEAVKSLDEFTEQFKKVEEAMDRVFLHGEKDGLEPIKQAQLIQPPAENSELESKTARIIKFVNTEFSKVSNIFKHHASNLLVLVNNFRSKCDINKLLATLSSSLKDLYEHAMCIGDTVVAQKAKDFLHYLGDIKAKWSKTGDLTKVANLHKALK